MCANNRKPTDFDWLLEGLDWDSRGQGRSGGGGKWGDAGEGDCRVTDRFSVTWVPQMARQGVRLCGWETRFVSRAQISFPRKNEK